MKKSTMINVMMVIVNFVILTSSAFAGNDGKVLICHTTGNGNSHAIWINQNALEAHIAHGDVEGTCSEEAELDGDYDVVENLEVAETTVEEFQYKMEDNYLVLEDVGLQKITAEAKAFTSAFNKIYIGAYNGYYNGDAVIEIALRTSDLGFKSSVNKMGNGSKTVTITITDDVTGEVINVTGSIVTHTSVATKWTNMQTNK